VVPRKSEEHILLVDDLALVRRTIPSRLAPMGRKVSSVVNVPEAWEWLEKHVPELILLDVVLPGKDGLAFCKELKADPRFQRIPVVMLTDVAGNIFDRCLEAGADDYLPKRCNDAYLRIRIHLHLQLAGLRKTTGRAPGLVGPSTILLATHSSLLQAQLPSQLSGEGHSVRLADRLDEVPALLTGKEQLLILDMSVDPGGIHEFLSGLRMNPEFASIPVSLLCDKDDVEHLTGLEFMLDDVLIKPLTAQVNRHRVRLLLEMGHLLQEA
jgi:DNA-binding response OmpR family regulator